jgi:hypothetical protein
MSLWRSGKAGFKPVSGWLSENPANGRERHVGQLNELLLCNP